MHKITMAILLCSLPVLAVQADPTASEGQDLYVKFKCVYCHGADGKTAAQPGVPPVAGLNADEIQAKTIQMTASAAHGTALKECGEPPVASEIRRIADYLAALPR